MTTAGGRLLLPWLLLGRLQAAGRKGEMLAAGSICVSACRPVQCMVEIMSTHRDQKRDNASWFSRLEEAERYNSTACVLHIDFEAVADQALRYLITRLDRIREHSPSQTGP